MAKSRNAYNEKQATNPVARVLKERLTTTKMANELAQKLECSPQAINQYKNGVSYPKTENLIKIADFFNVSVDYLLGRTNINSVDGNAQIVGELTGLSVKSVYFINSLKDKEFTQVGYSGIKMCEMLDLLLTSPRSYSFFNNLGMALLLRKSSEELTRRSPDEVPLEMEGLAQRGIFTLSNDAAASLFLGRAADDLKAIVNENGQPTG